MNEKVTNAAWLSSISTFLFSMSLPNFACLVGLISTIILTCWKIYVDIVHMRNERQLLQQNKNFSREEE